MGGNECQKTTSYDTGNRTSERTIHKLVGTELVHTHPSPHPRGAAIRHIDTSRMYVLRCGITSVLNIKRECFIFFGGFFIN